MIAVPGTAGNGQVDQAVAIEVARQRVINRIAYQRRTAAGVKPRGRTPIDVAGQILTGQFAAVLG